MKYITALVALLIFATINHAEIYKGKDAEGNVTYSDEETPDTTEIKIPEANTIPMPKPEPEKAVEAEEETGTYKIIISSPVNNETLRIASGDVPVSLSITPPLDIEQGHRISVYIDGAVSLSTTQSSFQMPNVSRDSHTLRVEIKNNENKVLKKSDTVKFHMKRRSSQHTEPGTTTGPKKPDGKPYTPGPQGVIFKPGPQPPAPAQ